MTMEQQEKTLAEWLLDPTTVPGDRFLSTSGKDAPVEVRVGLPGDIYSVTGLNTCAYVFIDYMRMKFSRCEIDLDKITAQQAIDRGLVKLAATP